MGLIGKGRLAKQVLANAVVGGTQGALQPVVEGESRANNAAFGAGGAAVGTVAAPVLGRVVGAATKPL